MNQISSNTYVDNRIEWLDAFKGILITLMVAAHAGCPFTIYIYLFHMPAFFFASGFTYQRDKYSLKNYIKKKLKRNLLPAFAVNIVYIIFYYIADKVGLYGLLQEGNAVCLKDNLKGLVIMLSTPDLGGATWFLFVLFETEVITCFLDKLIIKNGISPNFLYVILFLLGCLGMYLGRHGHYLVWNLDLAFSACLYYAAGIFSANCIRWNEIEHRLMFPFCISISGFLGTFYFAGKLPMNWPTRNFPGLFIQFLGVFTNIYLVVFMAKKLCTLCAFKFIKYLGSHTYCILILHFLTFKAITALRCAAGNLPLSDLQLLTPSNQAAANGGWLLTTILAICMCILIGKVSERNKFCDYLVNAHIPEPQKSK